MKKYISMVLALVLVCACFSGCGKKKKEVTLVLRTPPMSMLDCVDSEVTDAGQLFQKAAKAFSEQYKEADVNFNIETFEYIRETDAIPGNFDTDKATDILYEGYFNMGTYIHTGRVVPLDDIISDELYNDIDESLWDMSKINEKTYMMPYLSTQNFMIYNKELFRQCGLDEYIGEEDTITAWSLDEWNIILDTLAEKLPQGSFPIMMYAKNDQGDTHIMTMIRSHGSSFFDENGYFNLSTEKGIAGLQWIRDGYRKGWYPTQCERLELVDNTELFGNGQLAISMANNSSMGYYENMDYGIVNFPDVSGSGIVTSFVTGFEVFDNGDPDKVRVAKDFVRFMLETDKWAEYSTSGIPARNSVSEKYSDQIYMLDAFEANNVNVVDFMRNNPNWRGVRAVFYTHIQDLLKGEKTPSEAAAAIDADCNAAISKGREESILHE